MTARIHQMLLFLLCLGMGAAGAAAQRFFPDDPIWVDDDRLPIPPPNTRDLSQIADFLQSTFAHRPKEEEGPIGPAENINTVGGVPDSTWFTNRMERRLMTLDELIQGPNRGSGPDASGPWTIVRAKSQGISPGFTIRDASGDVYFLKFDPSGHPQLATSTEVIATKFFYAFGYHVPENYLTLVQPDNLIIGEGARVTDELGKNRRMRPADISEILRKVARLPDGRIQAIASKAVPGEPLGPFRYFGTRPDDANDIFPHQNRRELRGLRVFAAWLNHDDTRSINSLDTYISEGDAGYVLHHLIDFGSCLGSGSVKPQSRRAGNEYMLEWNPMLKAGLSFGLWDRPWRDVPYPDYPGVGRFESDYFQPQEWRPEYPNPAFDRMLPSDAFWAARIVQRFSHEAIQAMVRTGQLASAESERYLTDTLLERQRKIVRYYLSQLNPLDGFQVKGGRLEFENPGLEAGLASSASYRYRWFSFDNQTGESVALTDTQTTGDTSLPLPASDAPWLLAEVATETAEITAWSKPVRIFVRNRSTAEVVGIERED